MTTKESMQEISRRARSRKNPELEQNSEFSEPTYPMKNDSPMVRKM